MTDNLTLQQGGDERDQARLRSMRPAQPPTHVPGYEPERFLGAGAFGEVWVARNRNTGRRVAIKFYSHRGGLDWSLLSREVEKLSFLFSNRYVVQLLDVGWDAEPPYYVMEYLDNGSLEDRLRHGTLPLNEALVMFREVATGLVHAHGKGVLHCDLKPANVLLDQEGKPRLADFGQSRLTHEQTPSLGTLFYMAPEQADLEASPDARWDVYALGALMYAMLTGRPPHYSSQNIAHIDRQSSLEERLETYREIIRTSRRPRAHRKVWGVDRPLAEIIERCLATNPDKRYPNVQAVLEALKSRSLKRARRPLLVLGAVGPALLLAVVSSFAWSIYQRTERRSEELVTRRALEGNTFLAQFVAKGVANEVERRWLTLERVSADPEFRELLLRASEAEHGEPPREELQAMIERIGQRHPEVRATSWFVQDTRGIQLARWPYDHKTIGRDFSYRDYFHGQGQQLPPGTQGLEPIRRAYRSIVFRSAATLNRMVAFSVPVWSDREDNPDREVIGVLAMTVELGKFSELRPEHGASRDHAAILVDSRPDARGREGSVLEHPELATLLEVSADGEAEYFLEEEELERIERLREVYQQIRRLRRQEPRDEAVEAQLQAMTQRAHQLAKLGRFRDPIEGSAWGEWLAAVEPVIVEERPEATSDIGWSVIVQERSSAVALPVREMGRELINLSLTGLAVVLAVLTALWGFVIIVLNESPRSRWYAWLRRQAGLASEERMSDDPSSTNSGSVTFESTEPSQPNNE